MRIGEVIAERFELQALAGTGGMGAVYRARDLQNGLTVALKSLHDPGGRHAERFLREAQVLATLNHPNIVRYVAHGRTPKGELYMAMEWIEGESLSQRIADCGGLAVADSLLVTSQLASALAFAHARGIIHRDIKPSNVFVLKDSLVPKLLDFGIARLAQAARLTSNGMMLGTPGYMSPEQARGAASVTARADVFSLGCLLFKCLTARPPFMSEDTRGLMAQVLFETPPRVSTLRKDVPAALDQLVARMLAKEPSLRPADGAAVLAELRAVATGVPGADSPAFDVPEALGDGELQWICAVLARAPRATSGEQRKTAESAVNATQQAIPVAMFPDPKRPAIPEAMRHASAFELPQVEEGEVSPEIGTVMDSVGSAPADIVEALRPFDAEVDQLADGSLLTTLGDDPDPVVLAVRAVRCALALQQRRPELRVVIATGRALRADHPGVGPALDRAAGLLRDLVHGPPGVRLDVTTAQLVRGRYAVDVELQPPALGGEADPLSRPTAPLRGRERELGRLLDFAERAQQAGRVRWALLVGAPGVGLTRMVRELRAAVPTRAPGLQPWFAAADPAETHSPFALVRRVLAAAGVDPSRVPFEGKGATAPDLVAALVRVLAEASREKPALLVIDDLDRSDPASLALLARALPPDAALPIAVLAMGRKLAVSRLEPLGVSGELRELEPLADPLAAQIVSDRSGGVVTGDALEQLVRLAAGNAWMLRALVDGGMRLNGYPEPALARAASRLEGLGPEGRRVLRAVAVWDTDVARADLGALLGGAAADPAIDAQLEQLVRGGWLQRRGGELWGESTYRVVEPIVAAAAMAQFTESDRALAHRLAATRLEQRASPDAARIAWHWEQAGQPGRASEQHRRAAAAALGQDDLHAAAHHADRALSAGDPGLREALLDLCAEAHLWLGELPRARQAAAEIAALHPPASARAARAMRQLALVAVLGQDGPALSALADALLKLPVWAEPAAAFAGAVASTGLAERGDVARAQSLEARLPARPEDAIEPLTTAARLWVDAARSARRGDWAAAHPLHRACAQALAGADERRASALAQLASGRAALSGNALALAEAALRKVRAAAEGESLRVVQAQAALELARALFGLGQEEEAELRLDEALELAPNLGLRSTHGAALLLRAERHLAAARLQAASDDLGAALELLEPTPAMHLLVQARLAELRAAQGDATAAAALIRSALSRLDELGERAGAVELPVRAAGAELLLHAGLRDLGRAQLARLRERLAKQLQSLDPVWREALASDPDVRRAIALAGQWLG